VTNDFGGKLRLARERRGISLRQIAASTKISVAALEALERNDVSKLPGGIFSRAFVRSYAVEVGLDPDDTVREFLERFQGEPPPPAAVKVAVREEESSFESRQRIASAVLQLVLISVIVVAVILYFTLRARSRNSPDDREPGAAASAPAAAPATVPAAVTAPVEAPGQPATPPPDARPAGDVMQLALHPTGPCWISLTVDGERIMSRVMQPGERVVHEVRNSAVIEVGDAGAFAFSVNGRPGKSLGETGQVKTARLTKDTLADLVR
jgi:cytoskeletal protein RodZ